MLSYDQPIDQAKPDDRKAVPRNALNAGLVSQMSRSEWSLTDQNSRPGIDSAACAFATVAFSPAWPLAALLVVAACFGATGIGWNGVQLSEIARRSPPGEAGTITGASGFITFGGVV